MRGLMLLALALTTPAAAQNAEFKALMEKTNADVPVPSKAVMEADALKTLVAIAKEEADDLSQSGRSRDHGWQAEE